MPAALALLALMGAAPDGAAAFASFDRFCLQQPALFPDSPAVAKAAGWTTPAQELDVAPELRDQLFYPSGNRDQALFLNVQMKQFVSDNRACVLALHQGDYAALLALASARLGSPRDADAAKRYAGWLVPGTRRLVLLQPNLFMTPSMGLAAVDLIPEGPRPATVQFVAATRLCVNATKASGTDEVVLNGAGWLRTSTAAEEMRSSRRIYSHRSAIKIDVPLRAGRPSGCMPRADTPPEGGTAALVAALETAFGPTAPVRSGLHQWRLPSHSIRFVEPSGNDSPIGIAVTYRTGATE